MKLLEKTNLGPLTLPNRMIMAPLTRCRADNEGRIPTGLHQEYYRQRSGAGLIISEATVISTRGIGYVNTPGLYSDEQVEGWRTVTQAVHDAGGRIFVQLWHVGRISHPDFHQGKLPLAPSAIDPGIRIKTPMGRKPSVTPKAMSEAEIKETVQDYVRAAELAIDAGFDGVEIHSSNGYLIHQFFSGSSNRRSDHYGGSIQNRTRFYFEILDEVCRVIPSNRVGTRLNPMMHEKNGIMVDEDTLPTFEYIVQRLNDYRLAYLHLTRPFNGISETLPISDVPAHFRSLYKGHLMVNGNYNQETGEAVLANDLADSVCYGRPFISNPDLPERVRLGQPWAEADPATFYSSGPEGYITYPVAGKGSI